MASSAPEPTVPWPPPGTVPRLTRAASGSTARGPKGLVVASLAIAALFAAPLGYLIRENLTRGTDVWGTLRDERALEPLRRTLALGATVSLTTVTIGTVLAWLIVRTDLPGRRMWRAVAPLPLVIPSFVGALSLLAAFSPGGLVDVLLSPLGVHHLPRFDGFGGSVAVLTFLTYPYVYLPVSARLSTLSPSFEESARSLGHSPGNVFRTIVMPQTSGAVWAGALLVFLYSLSEFGAVQLLHYDTLTRAIFSARLFDRDASLALSLVLGAVALAVVAAERRVAARRARTETTGVGEQALRVPLGRWKVPALAFISLVVGLALVAPVAVLVHWVLRGVSGNAHLDVAGLVGPATVTGMLGIVTGLVAVAVVLPVAYLTARHRSRLGGVSNNLVVSGFALPGLVVAIAFVAMALATPGIDRFYQTYALLVAAYVVHFGSQAMRAAQVAVDGVPRRVEDAARSLGAGRVRRLLTVELPLMRGGLAAGAGLVLLSTMKELPATLVLRPIGVETLSTRVWASSSEGFYAQAGLGALALIAVSALLTWLLTARSVAPVD